MQAAIKGRYQAHLDAKKRLTLRELVRPEEISKRTLQMMDESIRNLNAGKVSAPIDLSGF